MSKVIYNDEYASIVHETDCVKPCKYRKYKLLGNKKEASFVTVSYTHLTLPTKRIV